MRAVQAGLLPDSKAVVDKRNLIADLHLVEQPFRVALENFCEVRADVASRFPEPVHDSAEGGFVYPQHSCQAVLADAGRVHSQLEIWIDISVQAHCFALDFLSALCVLSVQENFCASLLAIRAPNEQTLIWQHIVAFCALGSSRKISILPKIFKDMGHGILNPNVDVNRNRDGQIGMREKSVTFNLGLSLSKVTK